MNWQVFDLSPTELIVSGSQNIRHNQMKT